ncbi:zinc ribbon domain-containing protein [bacterium]|nr:zinc ribbon domain-containing protein [bacterium]
MPLYEYECRVCKKKFEVLQRMSDDESKLRCPKCQADKPKRILSLFSSAFSKSTSTACGPTGST